MGLLCPRGDGGTPPGNMGFNKDSVWDNTGKHNLGTYAAVGNPSPAYIHYVDQKWGLQTDHQKKDVHGRPIVLFCDLLVAKNENKDISTTNPDRKASNICRGVLTCTMC